MTSQPANDDRRAPVDRRERPTPMLSAYTLRGGRRRGGRRDGEDVDIYVDRYDARYWFLALGILALSCVDLVLTLNYLSLGGEEANPVMAWALDYGHDVFIGAKLLITSLGVMFLVVHHRFRMARRILETFFGLYVLLILYHVWLLENGAYL